MFIHETQQTRILRDAALAIDFVDVMPWQKPCMIGAAKVSRDILGVEFNPVDCEISWPATDSL